MSTQDLSQTRTSSLAALFRLAQDERSTWNARDLAAMLRHQLDAPLPIEAMTGDVDSRHRLQPLQLTPTGRIETLADLFQHDAPPVELLDACKRFAKAALMDADRGLPEDLAYVLYYLPLAAALVKHGQSITQLSSEELRTGLESVLRWDWLDDASRDLLNTARQRL